MTGKVSEGRFVFFSGDDALTLRIIDHGFRRFRPEEKPPKGEIAELAGQIGRFNRCEQGRLNYAGVSSIAISASVVPEVATAIEIGLGAGCEEIPPFEQLPEKVIEDINMLYEAAKHVRELRV